VAELVDALGSGPSGGNTVGVRVPSRAPFRCIYTNFLSHRSPTSPVKCLSFGTKKAQ